MLKKGYNFYFCTNVPGLNFFWLCEVWYCAESVFSILKFEYLSEIETKSENTLAYLLGAQMGSNDEINWGRNSRWTVPLKEGSSTGTGLKLHTKEFIKFSKKIWGREGWRSRNKISLFWEIQLSAGCCGSWELQYVQYSIRYCIVLYC